MMKMQWYAVCVLLVLASCGVEDTESEFFIPSKGGKADSIPAAYEAGTLDNIPATAFSTVTAGKYHHEDFSSGVYKVHRWKINHLSEPYLRLELETNNTFTPVIWVDYQGPWRNLGTNKWVSDPAGAWIVPTVDAKGTAKINMVFRAHRKSEEITISITSLEVGKAGLTSDAKVDSSAAYAIRVLRSVEDEVITPNDFSASLDGGAEQKIQSVYEAGGRGFHLEYKKTAKVNFFMQKYFFNHVYLLVDKISALPNFSEVVPSSMLDVATYDTGSTRTLAYLGMRGDKLSWTFGADREKDIFDGQDAKAIVMNVMGISIKDLIYKYRPWNLLVDPPTGIAEHLQYE